MRDAFGASGLVKPRLPEGGAAYAQALAANTTTTLGAEEIHAIGLREVARIHGEMKAIMAKVGFKGDFAAFLAFSFYGELRRREKDGDE